MIILTFFYCIIKNIIKLFFKNKIFTLLKKLFNFKKSEFTFSKSRKIINELFVVNFNY